MFRLFLFTTAACFAPSDGNAGSEPQTVLAKTSLGNIADGQEMPSQTLTIQKGTFVIPAPYVAGPIDLTEGEAAALNQTYAENIRNNFATQMKNAAEETPAKVLGQAELDTYVESYAFGKRAGGVRSRDPVGAEERRLIKDALTARIQALGKTVKSFSTEDMNALIAKAVAIGKFRAQAEAVVAARNTTVDPLAEFEIPDASPKPAPTPAPTEQPAAA